VVSQAEAAAMSLPLTLALLALFAALTVFCRWRGARPLDLTKGPRMIPWAALMLLSFVACLVLLAHLLNLGGVETGRRP
jgi:hypothetical protein